MDSNNLTPLRKGVVGVQFLFVAFGATVLVPLLVGLDPSTALFTAGIGTLIFHAVTRGKVPIFLGSSFAFIAPIIKATELYGLPGTLSGMVGVALVYFVMSALVKWQGVKVIERLFPPVVIGPVIILIGLSLAGIYIFRICFQLVISIILANFSIENNTTPIVGIPVFTTRRRNRISIAPFFEVHRKL